MKRLPRAVSVLLIVPACNQMLGIQEGFLRSEQACSSLADCEVAVPACRAALACEEGVCVFVDEIEGTPLDEQSPGDCAAIVCDGAGSTALIAASTDVFDDGNLCTLDTCDGMTPRHTPLPQVSCYTGPPGTRQNGICRPGTQRCDAEGNPVGACEGEVRPSVETCALPLDEDCDGQIDEEGDGCP